MKGWKIYSGGKLLSINSTRFGFKSNFINLKEEGLELQVLYEEITEDEIKEILEVDYGRNNKKSDRRIKK